MITILMTTTIVTIIVDALFNSLLMIVIMITIPSYRLLCHELQVRPSYRQVPERTSSKVRNKSALLITF